MGDIVATRHGDVEEAERHVGCRGDDKWWPRTWRRSLVNVIAELTDRGVRCECQESGCSCSNDADLREIHRRRPRLQLEFDKAGLP